MPLRHTLMGDVQTSVKDFSLLEQLVWKERISNIDVYYEKHISNSSLIVYCNLRIKYNFFFLTLSVSPAKELLMQRIQIKID